MKKTKAKKKKISINRAQVARELEMAGQEHETGNFQSAKMRLLNILKVDPKNGEALWRLSMISHHLGDTDKAIVLIKKCLIIEPDLPICHNSLGLYYTDKRMFDASIDSFEKALDLDPNFVEANCNIGGAYLEKGNLEQAEKYSKKALFLNPSFWRPCYNLAIINYKRHKYEQALKYYQQALSITPNIPEVYNNLGLIHVLLGQHSDAEACYRKALSLNPNHINAFHNLIFSLNYNPSSTNKKCYSEARKFAEHFFDNHQQFEHIFNNEKSSPLRIGFVSGDFKRHPVGFFLANLLTGISKKNITLTAYNTSIHEDDLTTKLKSHFASWRSIAGLSDIEAARCIHDDNVNILIDLSGHTDGNRLQVFALKPSPVQVSWLGYWGTTGMNQMDYLLTDEVSVPVDQQKYFSEEIWYLPQTPVCFSPPDIHAPVTPLPSITKGYFTFGGFHNPAKVNDFALSMWSRILTAIPRSVLLLQNRRLDDSATRKQLLSRLKGFGVDEQQVILRGSMSEDEYFASYAEVDCILDAFPYSGCTTTCEGLWMGVPTLTLKGNIMTSRQSSSVLTAAGLADWIVTSEDDYIAKAVSVTKELRELAELRSGLRNKVESSQLCDTEGFADNFESALKNIWQEWCKKPVSL